VKPQARTASSISFRVIDLFRPGLARTTSPVPADLITKKALQHRHSNRRAGFHLEAGPDTDLQDPLEFLRSIVPPIVVAEGMRRKIVLDGMWSTAGVRQDVVRLPMRHYGAATDVAASRSLVKHMRAVARSQAPSTNPSCRTASDIPLTPSLTESD